MQLCPRLHGITAIFVFIRAVLPQVHNYRSHYAAVMSSVALSIVRCCCGQYFEAVWRPSGARRYCCQVH